MVPRQASAGSRTASPGYEAPARKGDGDGGESIGVVVGLLTVAQVRSQTGSFAPALYGFAAVALVALVLASVVKPPSRG